MATVVAHQEETFEKARPLAKEGKAIASEPTPGRLTLEQANKLANGRPFELIDGRMIFKMPDRNHARTQLILGAKLFNYLLNNPIAEVLTEFTHRFWPNNPHEGRVPDLSVIFNENVEEEERFATRAPDIAIEIISRDDAWTQIFEKVELYFEKGSREVWLVDPYQKGVMIITPETRRWEWQTLASPELLPGFQVELKDIFEWPAAKEKTEAEQQ